MVMMMVMVMVMVTVMVMIMIMIIMMTVLWRKRLSSHICSDLSDIIGL